MNKAQRAAEWLVNKVIVCSDHYVLFTCRDVVELAHEEGIRSYALLEPLDLAWKGRPSQTKGLQRITGFADLADQSEYMIFDTTANAAAWCEAMHADDDEELDQ